MIFDRVQLVVPDGAGLAVPISNIEIYENTDVTLPYSLVHASGTAYNLSGNVNAVMAFRATPDGPIILQLSWTITSAPLGQFNFNLLRAHRLYLGAIGPTNGKYYYGIQFIDSDLNVEDAIMAPSTLTVHPQMGDFSNPVTLTSAVFGSVPDPSTGVEGSVLSVHNGVYSLNSLVFVRVTAVFDGTQDYKDVSWSTSLSNYGVTVGEYLSNVSAGVFPVGLSNQAATSIRVTPASRFTGSIWLLICGVP